MSITKTTTVTLRTEISDEHGATGTIVRHISGGNDELVISFWGRSEVCIPTLYAPALIAGLQELLGAE